MADTASTPQKIIQAAETRMRQGGFHGFSFREIAADVGIKSASVHHHFPTKDDLAVAVARSYRERHEAALGDPNDPAADPTALMARFVDLFRSDLVVDRMMCLCGVLAGETSALSPRVAGEVRLFFDASQHWLETVLRRAAPGASPEELADKALLVVATLEGALLIGHCHGEPETFERTVSALADTLSISTAE